MSKPRVAPKNIQFQENIEIREIPRPSEAGVTTSNLVSRRDSWDPNLANKNVIKRKRPDPFNRMVIGIVGGGIALLLIIIGVVLGVVLSQKKQSFADNSRGYGETCTVGSNQCTSSASLVCSGGLCSCASPYSWNTATSTCTLLTYNQVCSTVNQCNSSLGLNCTNSICQCDGYHAWSSINNTCVTIQNGTLSYGATCLVGLPQCNSTVDLTCTGNCTCMNSKVWNVTGCVCRAGTFLNSSNLCQTAYSINHTCTIGSNQCDSTKDLFCNNNNLCQCDFSTKYWNLNFEKCMQRVNYTGICTYDNDCVPTLICPPLPGVCNCPQYLPDYSCNCADTKYYDASLLQCVNRATNGGSCLTPANYTCLATLYCNAGTCACPTGTTWSAGTSTCISSG